MFLQYVSKPSRLQGALIAHGEPCKANIQKYTLINSFLKQWWNPEQVDLLYLKRKREHVNNV